MRTCDDCKFCVYQDTGHSNWTVEGTDFYCGAKAHPNDGFDRWYKEDPNLNFAEQCLIFAPGVPIHMDVDHTESLTPEEKRIYDKAMI